MNTEERKDFASLCLHTITTKPWSVEQATENYASAGVKGISVWREVLQGKNISAVGDSIREQGLEVVSLVRGGFFAATAEKGRQGAIDDNRRAIDEAAALGSPLLVLVCGVAVEQSLSQSREQIKEGIEKILPYAEQHYIKLAIEPLHPMYADCRSAINTMKQANEMVAFFNSPHLGVAVDVYHVWWDPDLSAEIAHCGKKGKLFAFHICDWLTPTEDVLNDRGLMGEGCIPLKEIRTWMRDAGFNGYDEVEIFSTKYWAGDQHHFLERIKEAYLHHCL
jgi:sugar phosphate isomerase/epimerase